MIGIDKINLFTPGAYVDLTELAKARNIDPDKFTIGIGQERMAIAPITQDCYSMAANACVDIVDDSDKKLIDLVIFATESSNDYSKSGAVIVQKLTGIHNFTRSFEIKQACFGATAGILLAKDYIKNHPGRKALVVGSDIAKYGLDTPGEVTQGAGAVAMLISENPRLIALDDISVPYADDVYDFWRPEYSDVPFVDGKFSNQNYLDFFKNVWTRYREVTNAKLDDFTALCFHLPYTKMGLKALKTILDEASEAKQEELLQNFTNSAKYTRYIGNLYTASLYLSILSLLNNAHDLKAGDKIGFFSYGSGASSEFFTGHIVEGFKDHLQSEKYENTLNTREILSIAEYESLFNKKATPDTPQADFKCAFDRSRFYLSQIKNNIRMYQERK